MKKRSAEAKEHLTWFVVCLIFLVLSWFAFSGENGEPLFKVIIY